jgi:hypothetical protein
MNRSPTLLGSKVAGGSKTGLNGISRNPHADARLRRGLARAGQTNLLTSGTGTYINSVGEIEVQLSDDSLILVTDFGLQVNAAAAGTVITGDVFSPRPAPQLPSQALALGSAADSQGILASQIFGG